MAQPARVDSQSMAGQMNSENLQVVGVRLIALNDKGREEYSADQLFSAYDPLNEFTLNERSAALRKLALAQETESGNYTLAGQQRYQFWRLLIPGKIQPLKFNYSTIVTDTCLWEISLSDTGIEYRDISGSYGLPGKIYSQLLVDFWFYGPIMPIPDLAIRRDLLDFIAAGFEFDLHPKNHFRLFDYPVTDAVSVKLWEDGDFVVSDFVVLRNYGVEYGRQNFHDGLVWLGYLSFEQLLFREDLNIPNISESVKDQIREILTDHLLSEGNKYWIPY